MSSPSAPNQPSRMRPLLCDPRDPGLYAGVLVDSMALYQAVQKASKSNKPAHTLLNQVINLVFSRNELASCSGLGIRPKGGAKTPHISALDATKVAALHGKYNV